MTSRRRENPAKLTPLERVKNLQKQTEAVIALLCLSVLTVSSSAQAIDLSPFPGPNHTGVPKGTELTPYTGPLRNYRTERLRGLRANHVVRRWG
ncbi:hypothetical protein SAMN05216228_1006115 [Rhizobium tibeticum]|uniref:Uncharacterized protein n=1 Tax=Rhizobium tibeticum TaxID=501024 RepID=A0ABY1AJ25_9HYPH|nr:hypothetical protein [Rhizobium tibeticum]SEN67280.1 hypothetical protein SAMN05216228_1006115 [Rhizobium tibeticum]